MRWFGVLAIVLALSGASPAKEVRVITTTTDLAEVLRTVGGDRVRITTLCKGYQDPHYLEAKPSFVVDVRRADLLAYVGLQLEIGWLPLLIDGSRNADLVAGARGNLPMSAGLAVLEVPEGGVSRAQGDVHPEGNPHYWLDPRNLAVMARTAAAGLARIDPQNGALFETNRAAFERRLEEAIPRWEARMAPHRGKQIVCYHKTWEYLLAWLGLEVAGYVENRPGIPPSPKHVQEIEAIMRQRGIQVILAEVFVGTHQVEGLARRTGAQLLILPTSVQGEDGVDDLFQLFERLTTALDAALSQEEH